MKAVLISGCFMLGMWGCVSLTPEKIGPPPKITSKIPLKEAVEAAIDH